MDTLLELLTSLGPRIALNAAGTALLLARTYGRGQRSDEQLFAFWLLNAVVFGVVSTLSLVRIDLGLGLGLFGVFGILRYRTESMQGRDLTILFAVIGIALLSGVATTPTLLLQVGVVIAMILAVTALALGGRGPTSELWTLHYDRTDLLAPERRAALLEDLAQRLGTRVLSVTIRRVDLVKHNAELQVVVDTTAR